MMVVVIVMLEIEDLSQKGRKATHVCKENVVTIKSAKMSRKEGQTPTRETQDKRNNNTIADVAGLSEELFSKHQCTSDPATQKQTGSSQTQT